MSQIEELQRRIVAAMERISASADGLHAAPAGLSAPDPDLQSALDEERLANAQLEERLKSLKERHERETDTMRADLEALRASAGDDAETGALREQVGRGHGTARLGRGSAGRIGRRQGRARKPG